MIPGSNLLEDAFELIGTVEITFERYLDRVKNPVGQWIASYGDPVKLEASVQSVDRSRYAQWGLDYQKAYRMIYCSVNAMGVDRNRTGDRFLLPDGYYWKVESENSWFYEDGGWMGVPGWVGVMVVLDDYQAVRRAGQ